MAHAYDIPLEKLPPAASAWIGAAGREITPPVGIYARQWGAAKQDVATGIHRPLFITCVSMRDREDGKPLILIGGDMTWFRHPEEDLEKLMLEPVQAALGIDRSRVVLNCSHTHAAVSITSADHDKPGGELIAPYLQQVARAVLEIATGATQNAQPATLTWATGRCALATNRDLPEPPAQAGEERARLRTGMEQRDDRLVCGFNPANKAHDTLLVGRVTRDSDDKTIATLVNYACHPTTLAWDNSLISPDYVGALREVVEAYTDNAPMVFLQGASGELSPAIQYTGDLSVADGHGRYVGHCVVAALASMQPPRQGTAFSAVVESGAPLAVWKSKTFEPSGALDVAYFDVMLPLKDDLPTVPELKALLAECTDRTLGERLYRKIQLMSRLGEGRESPMGAWIWRVGQTLFVLQSNEAYSRFQLDLREAFPDYAVVVTNLSNGTLGYLPVEAAYDQDIYQVWQTPYARTALATLTRACIAGARALVGAG